MRLLLALLILVSFLGLAAHHHEAGHGAHDCPVCRIAQTLLVLIIARTVFMLMGPAPSIRLPLSRTFPRLVSVFEQITPPNRAPPFHS